MTANIHTLTCKVSALKNTCRAELITPTRPRPWHHVSRRATGVAVARRMFVALSGTSNCSPIYDNFSNPSINSSIQLFIHSFFHSSLQPSQMLFVPTHVSERARLGLSGYQGAALSQQSYHTLTTLYRASLSLYRCIVLSVTTLDSRT